MTETLARAIDAWNRGEHYDAHELLEEVAEALEDDEEGYAVALALVHTAASLHKLVNDVGKNAVPAKLGRALEVLEGAPSPWLGIDLAALRVALGVLHADLASRGVARAFTADEMPRIARA